MNYLSNLRKLRNQKNMTMKALGTFLDVSESTISFYENGKREPGIDILLKIADFFEVSLDELIKDENSMPLLNTPPTFLTEDDDKMLSLYNQLDDGDKGEIRGEIKGMLRHEKYALTQKERRA